MKIEKEFLWNIIFDCWLIVIVLKLADFKRIEFLTTRDPCENLFGGREAIFDYSFKDLLSEKGFDDFIISKGVLKKEKVTIHFDYNNIVRHRYNKLSSFIYLHCFLYRQLVKGFHYFICSRAE